MACCDAPLLGQLQNIVTELSSNLAGAPCCKQPCCPAPVPAPPHPICCMPCPPPLLLPTIPEPVKPLMMPVEKCEECAAKKAAIAKEKEKNKNCDEGNFYNNYNLDYREETRWKHTIPVRKFVKTQGITLSGQPACCCCANKSCEENKKIKQETGADNNRCPTGTIPCIFQLAPSPDCCGAWCVQIKPCPKDNVDKKKTTHRNRNEHKQCSKPCCKHWKPKEGECQYDLPCKAACFNHPPGLKPKHHVPAIDYELLKVLGNCINNDTRVKG